MRGIAGFFDVGGAEVRPDAAMTVSAQIAILRHRRPDAQGIHLKPGLRLCVHDIRALWHRSSRDGPDGMEVIDQSVLHYGEP